MAAECRGVNVKRGPPVGVAGGKNKDNNQSPPGMGDHMLEERVCRS